MIAYALAPEAEADFAAAALLYESRGAGYAERNGNALAFEHVNRGIDGSHPGHGSPRSICGNDRHVGAGALCAAIDCARSLVSA